MIDIKGLDKAEVLLALWMTSKMQGMSFLGYGGEYTLEMARKTVNENKGRLYFDYLNGRVMKVDISGDEFDERLYDRDNGAGTAQKTISELREKGIEAFMRDSKMESSAKSAAMLGFAMFLSGQTFGGYNPDHGLGFDKED